jgi:WD40 repeat protein/serine/threonine protein kinase
MDQQRWKKIDDVFEQMLEIELAERVEALAQISTGDDDLRRSVEALLEFEAPAEKFLQSSAIADLAAQMAGELVTLTPGQRIGHYEIKEPIGAGGMGEVWRARDKNLDRDVAIKILPPEFSVDADRVRRFEREARTISKIKHSNIIAIHDIGAVTDERDDLHFIVTELVEGRTLRERLNDPRIGWREAVQMAAQIADALKTVHIVEVIHRDIKPENVMIQTDRRVKLLDFGIAKPAIVTAAGGGDDRPAAGVQTRLGATPGTLRYMSPEQARGEDLDARTDVFSLGLVLYEMIAGRHPYAGKCDEEIIEELKSEKEILPVPEAQPRIPAALDRIVAKTLRKKREERYPSGGEALADLERLKSLIEVKSEKEEGKALRAENADQLLTQFVVFHDADRKTRIPLDALLTIWRFADLKRGKLERELIRKSLVSALVGAWWKILLIVTGTLLFAAWVSVSETWEERILRDGHVAAVRRVVFSPDGRLLASGGVDRQVIVWDFARRERLKTLNEHSDSVGALAFSPDGKWLATGGGDGLIVWDTASWGKVTTKQFTKGRIDAVGFSPNGKLLAAALSVDNSTLLWQTGDWRQVGRIPKVDGFTATVLFTPDSRRLIFSQSDGAQPNVWDTSAGKPIGPAFEPEWGGNCGALSPDGKMLVNIDGHGDVKFIDLERRKLLSRQKGHFFYSRSAAFSPDGQLVATGSNDIVLWEAATQRLLARMEHTDNVWSLTFSPDGQWLVSTHGDGAILLWDVAMRRRVANFGGHSGPVRNVVFSPDGSRLASSSDDQSVIIWDREGSRKQAVLTDNKDGTTDMIFSSQPGQITTVNATGTIRVWDIANHRRQETPGPGTTDDQHDGYYLAQAYSPDLRWVTSLSAVLERASGRVVFDYRAITDNHDRVLAAAFSRDGQRLACVTGDEEVVLLETGTWRVLARRKAPSTVAIRVSFSPNGENLAVGGYNGHVWLWSVNPLRQIAELGRHDTHVEAVVFSPDGSRLASASDDRTIYLWDVGSHKLITRVGTHSSPVLSLAFSPNGRQIISGEQDHSVRLYMRRRGLWGWRLDH